MGPALSLEYTINEEVSVDYNQYFILDAIWEGGLFTENEMNPYYSEKPLSEYWDLIYIYAFKLNRLKSFIKKNWDLNLTLT